MLKVEASQLSLIGERLLEAYRQILYIDPFYKINIAIGEGDFASECKISSQPLSWNIVLNPSRHLEEADIQYSIVESLINILFKDMDIITDTINDKYISTKNSLIAKLTTSISVLLPTDLDE